MKFLILIASLAVLVAAASAQDKKVVCYYGSWAVYRPGDGKFDVEDINPMICTHLIYGFTGLEADGTLKILDPWNELEENWGRGAMRRFTNLKQQNPALKTLLAVGGWNEGSEKYSAMAQTKESRKKFIDSVVPFLELYNFDGFDLDWEYPTQRGGHPEDKANFALLCQEMKAEFSSHGWLLTAAVSAGEPTIAEAYDVPSISKTLDFINVMAYDLHGGWEQFVHHQAPQAAIAADTGNNTMLNVQNAIEFWIAQGADPSKLILGMGTYGRGWLLDDENNSDFYAPAANLIPAGPYTREAGILGYNEIVEKLAAAQWKIVRDPAVGAPYAVNGREWVGYDDEESIALRVSYAIEKGLGGAMFWSVETDDFRGKHSSEPFPLIKTAYRALQGDIATPGPTTTTTVDPTAPTTTSTQRPTPPPDGTCHSAGPMPFPGNCRKFIVCNDLGNGEWQQLSYDCPAGTIYDPSIKTCNWEADVPNAGELCKTRRH